MNQSGSGLENILLIALGKAKIKERVRERKKGKKQSRHRGAKSSSLELPIRNKEQFNSFVFVFKKGQRTLMHIINVNMQDYSKS